MLNKNKLESERQVSRIFSRIWILGEGEYMIIKRGLSVRKEERVQEERG